MSETNGYAAVAYHSALSDWYSLLCYFLQAPSEEMIEQLGALSASGDVRSMASEAGVEAASLAEVLQELDELHRSVSEGRCGLSDIRQEYTRLFMHPKHPCVQPYESMFVDGERVAAGKQSAQPCLFVNPIAMNAVEHYKRAGFRVPGHELPADHMVVELEFASKMHCRLASLVHEASTADDGEAPRCSERFNGLSQQFSAFKEEHLLNWMPRFFERLSQEGRGPLYPCVGALGCVLMDAEGDQGA
ncbi:molecular chaperone TorD family protein [Adlercreutzia sp. R7]|uniref:Molecular chaperone TorD family protein n=1 Tax=Adlercreutzia wanghongyangiae TaxID=3111451 RepID=A0ABU6IF88_9ACTN|nr:molecular chaperone TorD family protein [Adlercreutzia sp. R7]